ncbi:MAG: hypothetical protein QOE11_1326 [Solirubrobacteraceae bacterium]|jgi:hypothetical protein|nr:hypothetical protein [Solirubrobacteraceae bacterium]
MNDPDHAQRNRAQWDRWAEGYRNLAVRGGLEGAQAVTAVPHSPSTLMTSRLGRPPSNSQ